MVCPRQVDSDFNFLIRWHDEYNVIEIMDKFKSTEVVKRIHSPFFMNIKKIANKMAGT